MITSTLPGSVGAAEGAAVGKPILEPGAQPCSPTVKQGTWIDVDRLRELHLLGLAHASQAFLRCSSAAPAEARRVFRRLATVDARTESRSSPLLLRSRSSLCYGLSSIRPGQS